MNAKTVCLKKRRCSAPPAGQLALLQRGSAAALPLLVGHSHMSGPGGQEISFCLTIDHCRTILCYILPYCKLFTTTI